jgi:hypothetical protein
MDDHLHSGTTHVFLLTPRVNSSAIRKFFDTNLTDE